MLPRGRVYRYPPGRNMSDMPMGGAPGGMLSVPYSMGGMPYRDAPFSKCSESGCALSFLLAATKFCPCGSDVQSRLILKNNNGALLLLRNGLGICGGTGRVWALHLTGREWQSEGLKGLFWRFQVSPGIKESTWTSNHLVIYEDKNKCTYMCMHEMSKQREPTNG